ncbi:MAG: DUF1285 domain-containing protein [Hyphomicrobiales bacterium]|jgi:hypothetical protein
MAKASEENTETPPAFSALLQAAASGKRNPPVDQWNPALCGAIDVRIAADGTWYHEGRPIRRSRLVKLFSSILRKDEDGVTYLVTPHEKLSIRVDDAPLVVVDYAAKPTSKGDVLVLRTSMGDVVEVDERHPLRFIQEVGSYGLKPYVLVRGRIEALLNRATTMALVNDERFVDLTQETPVLRSGGQRFPILPDEV